MNDSYTHSSALLEWTFPDGHAESERAALAPRPDGTLALCLGADAIRAKGATRLVVTPDFGHAAKGEAGWWFSPYGIYGEFDCDEGRFYADDDRMNMPMFGWSTPRGAWLAVIESLKYYPKMLVVAEGGRYAVSCVLDGDLCSDPYEDFGIAYHPFPAGTGYAALARRYREYQLARGAVKPLRERVRDNPALRYAVEAPEIRIRQAWKPVPSPVPHQQPENEPPVKVAATFGRVKDIVRALKAAGVDKAELCLVGWNIGGHDGRWPQSFPAEPLLGGDEGLRDAIAFAQAEGFQIVPHGNFRDTYVIADSWDAEWTVKNPDGSLQPDRNGKFTWGGGLPYVLCPQRAYEKFCTKDIPRMAAFGFRGIGYFDVVTILQAPRCADPRHPCSRGDSARYWGLCAEISKRELGGFGSEGSLDHFAGSLDSVLYAAFESPPSLERRDNPGRRLAKGHIPVFQLVYNGILVQNPFCETVNPTIKSRYWQLKFIEYGGRPNFYFHSQFREDGAHWMGMTDLRCTTDEDLAAAAAKIREGADLYARLSRLQYEFMDGHDALGGGVFRTTYSDGTRVYVNYGEAEAEADCVHVPALGWTLSEPQIPAQP